MIEKDFGREKIGPDFSAVATIYDKVNDIHFIRLIETTTTPNLLKEFTLESKENPKKSLNIKVRFDSSDKSVKPNVIINNHDGKEIIYILKERFDRKFGAKYFSLGAPPQDIHNYGKAVKADFRVILDIGKEIPVKISDFPQKPLLA